MHSLQYLIFVLAAKSYSKLCRINSSNMKCFPASARGLECEGHKISVAHLQPQATSEGTEVLFSSNEPQTNSSTIYINASRGATPVPFAGGPSQKRRLPCAPRGPAGDHSARNGLPNRFPTSGIWRKYRKEIDLPNFVVES